jgi:demethylmenaquinone methyltransferase/2-methoxy-6-polyprenyl-1,4-benzoquinol methylase
MDRYTFSARFYDVISGEWPVYRAGRVVGIDLLAPRAGDEVLDLACGTGLNFPHLQRRIGPSGSITAIDISANMLDRARRRVRISGWNNVRLIEADATDVKPETLGGSDQFDAAICTYGLSLMPHWRCALTWMVETTRDGGRVAVVDMQKPVGWAAVWSPLAQLACQLGGSDINAHPWTQIESSLVDVRAASVRGGHIQARVGSIARR